MPSSSQLYIDLLKASLCASLYDESAWEIVDGASPPAAGFLRHPVQGTKDWFRSKLFGWLRKRSYAVVQMRPFNPSRRENGQDWPMFGYSMVGHRRLENLQQCIEDVLRDNVPGDFIETGVWRGGSTIFMRALLKVHGVTDRMVWVADSFEGLPPPASKSDGWDLSEVDFLKVSVEQVQANFARFQLLDDQVRFLKGWFCDSLPNAPIERLAILRLDGDLYSSTMDALRSLYHRVSPRGYVIVDDYFSWEPCRRAVGDFLKENGTEVQIKAIDGQAAYWRVPA